MHTYRATRIDLWTVGFERTDRIDSWRAMKEFPTEEAAAA